MDIKNEFENNLEKIIEDVQDVTQQMRLLHEYRTISKLGELFKKYDIYFETIYSYLHNFVILSFFKLYDKSGKDCISIYTLRKSIEKDFEQIFSNPKRPIENPKPKTVLLQEIKDTIAPVMSTIEKIRHIRNRAGLAHGMPNDFSVTISLEELKLLMENTQMIVNCIYARYQDTTVLFGEGIIHVKTLCDLAKDYEKILLNDA